MNLPKRTCLHRHRNNRRGAALVELAVSIPVLLIIALGLIDAGQYANVGQIVSNASREGARLAARNTTLNTSQVTASVSNYVTNIYPHIPASGLQINVLNASGGAIPGGDLTNYSAGSPISVQVLVDYEGARWLNSLRQLDNATMSATTVARRE